MSDRIVHLVEVAAKDTIGTYNLIQQSQPLRYIATVNRHNIIVHGAAQPDDLRKLALTASQPERRIVQLMVEEDSDQVGPAFRSKRYTATVDKHNIILHGAARSDDGAGLGLALPADGTGSSLGFLATPSSRRHTGGRKISRNQDDEYDEDNDSEPTVLSIEGGVGTTRQRNTGGISERIKIDGRYINRRQNVAITRPGPDADGKFIVETILEQAINPEDKNDPLMRVKWEGYGSEDSTWEPRTMLIQDAPEEVRMFDRRQSRALDEQSLSPSWESQTWPRGLSEIPFDDLDVASQDVDMEDTSSFSGSSHNLAGDLEGNDSDDDDAPLPHHDSKTMSSPRKALLSVMPALQGRRAQSPDSVFDGPTPNPSFWEPTPDPPTHSPETFTGYSRTGRTPGLFVTSGPQPPSAMRKPAGPQPARSRLGPGFSVPEGTRTNRTRKRAEVDGLGFARALSGGQTSSLRHTPVEDSNATVLQSNQRRSSMTNKRKETRSADSISPKRTRLLTSQ